MIKLKFILLICLLCACCDFCLASATERYQVKVNTHLNIRLGPGASYKSVGTLHNGSYVNVVSIEGEWAKIKYAGGFGYVNKGYIRKVPVSTPGNSHSTPSSSVNMYSGEESFLILIVVLFIAFLLVNMFTSGGNAAYLILFFLVPVLLIVYLLTASHPIWFMSPSKVGWVWVIINGFGMLLMAASMWGIVKSVFIDMFRERSLDWFSVLSLLLYAAALFLLITTAISEFLIIGVLMIIGSASGSSYVGEFTDRHGNRWEVWRK